MKPFICSAMALGLLVGCSATDETFHLEELNLSGERDSAASQERYGPVLRGVSADAKQRFIWSPRITVRDVVGEENGLETFAPTQRAIVCAEPSPDALVALAAATSGSASGGDGTASAAASFSRTVSEDAQQIGERTQTMQLMRDTLYRACEAYSNGALDSFGYSLILGQIDTFMLQMMGIDTLGKGRKSPEERGFELLLQHRNSELALARADDLRLQSEWNAASQAVVTATAAGIDGDELTALKTEQTNKHDAWTSNKSRVDSAIAGQRQAQRDLISAQSGAGGLDASAADDISKIVQTAVTGQNHSSKRAAQAACLMWYARHPQVKLDPNGYGAGLPRIEMADGSSPPAIAVMCAQSWQTAPGDHAPAAGDPNEWIDK